MQTYIMVDLENIPCPDITSCVMSGVKIVIMVGAALSQDKHAESLKKRLVSSGISEMQIECVKVAYAGHNSLDFHLVRLLSKLEEISPDADFVIVSKDQDYSTVMKTMKSEGRRICAASDIRLYVDHDALLAQRIWSKIRRLSNRPARWLALINYVAYAMHFSVEEALSIAKTMLQLGRVKLLVSNASSDNPKISFT